MLGSSLCASQVTLTNNAVPITGGGSARQNSLNISNITFHDINNNELPSSGSIPQGGHTNISPDTTNIQFTYLGTSYTIPLSAAASSNIFPTDSITQYVLVNVSNLNTIAKDVTFYDSNKKALSSPTDLIYTGKNSIPIPVNAVSFSIASGKNDNYKMPVNGGTFNLTRNKSITLNYDDNRKKWTIIN